MVAMVHFIAKIWLKSIRRICKNITTYRSGFVGSVSLLLGSITGPGLVTIPTLFQDAGWFL